MSRLRCACGKCRGHLERPDCEYAAPKKPAPRPKKRKPSRRFYEAANVPAVFSVGEQVLWEKWPATVINTLRELPDIVLRDVYSKEIVVVPKRDVRKIK